MFLTDPPIPLPTVVMPRYRTRTPLAAKIAWLASVSARKPMLTRVGLLGIYEMPQTQSMGTIEEINSNEIDPGDIAAEQIARFRWIKNSSDEHRLPFICAAFEHLL
ncbi:unnamed protein product [Lasius platythorax]|uniref:Uncharacterized protein n=1 Tax=Lasius platythorax TaxID=488582 RepID=A0AAV2P8R5_9HYME